MILLLLACHSGPPGMDKAQSHPLDDSGEVEPTGDSAERGDTGDPGPDLTIRAPLQLAFPLREAELFKTILGVDHDPVIQDPGITELLCADYLGRSFPHCYDEHDGSDYLLEGNFSQMDNGSATILAAAAGTVVEVEDGHYDRCHGDLTTGTVNCDGHDGIANRVIVEHEGGYRTLYWHMKEGSVAVVLGQTVEAGDALGLVGSSGFSTQPHLHFELQDSAGSPIDPYAGPLSQAETWWCEQGDPEGLPGDCP